VVFDFSKYDFVYNAAAHFAAMDRFPDGLWLELVKPGKAGHEALCWALAETSLQGELIRRDMGRDKRETLDENKLRLYLKPRQINEARTIVLNAMTKGLSNDDDNEEIDEVLLENQKKTETD
jgi:hypothetical protein